MTSQDLSLAGRSDAVFSGSSGAGQKPRPDMPSDRRPLKILVVDDEPVMRDVLSLYLTEYGHQVGTAVDGSDGLEKYSQDSWDLVLTDGIMPGMGGRELATAIKKINANTPVFLVSGSADMLLKGGEAGSPIDIVIRKPFTRATLNAALAGIR